MDFPVGGGDRPVAGPEQVDIGGREAASGGLPQTCGIVFGVVLRQALGLGQPPLVLDAFLAAVGLAMIVPMFVPSRWRARRIPESELIGDPEYLPGFGGITEPLLPTDPASYSEQDAQAGPASPLPGAQHQTLPSGLPRRLPRLPRRLQT